MKQMMVTVLIGIVIGIGLSGCSEDGDTPVVVPEKPSLVFRTSGTYDLSQYLAPTINQINNYRDKSYQDNTGTRTYTSDANESFYAINYEINGSVAQALRDDTVIKTYTTQSDRIHLFSEEKNSTIVYVRFAAEDQYVVLAEERIGRGETIDSSKSSCKIVAHNLEREVVHNPYTDVLKVDCQFNSTNHSVLAETEIKTVIDTRYTAYLAKDIGLVESTYNSCTSNTFGGLTEKKCKKIVTELTTYN